MLDWVHLVKVLKTYRDDKVMCFFLEFITVICFYAAMYFYALAFIHNLNKADWKVNTLV